MVKKPGRPFTVENSVWSGRRAVRHGADITEFDTQPDRDGTRYLMHDLTVDRTTDGSGPVDEKTDGQMSALRTGDGTRVPRALTFLRKMRDTSWIGGYRHRPRLKRRLARLRLELEIKPPVISPAPLESFMDRVHGLLLAQRGTDAAAEDAIMWTTLRPRIAGILHAHDPAAHIALIFEGDAPEVSTLGQWSNLVERYVLADQPRVDAAYVAAATDVGVSVGVWNVNTLDEAVRLTRAGVRELVTDDLSVVSRRRLEAAGICS